LFQTPTVKNHKIICNHFQFRITLYRKSHLGATENKNAFQLKANQPRTLVFNYSHMISFAPVTLTLIQ